MTTEELGNTRETMEQAVGATNISDDVARYTIDGLQPAVAVFPTSTGELSQAVAAASAKKLAITPWGGGTRIELGNSLQRLDAVIDLSRMNSVVEHNPGDLTCIVEAGISMTSLQEALAGHKQYLTLDPPLPDRASIGGILATGTGVPLMWQFGNMRDLVIGMKVVQADGAVTQSGGQVVKNVSGFDMSRLHIGAVGTLGIIAEVSFRLSPIPDGQTTLVATFENSQQCQETGFKAFHSDVVPLEMVTVDQEAVKRAGLSAQDGANLLAFRLAGRPLTLERQTRECESLCRQGGAISVETLDEQAAGVLWRKITDFGWDENTRSVTMAHASVPPAGIPALHGRLADTATAGAPQASVITHPGYGTVTVHWFSQEDTRSTEAASNAIARVREAVHEAGGRLIVDRCPVDLKRDLDVWDDVGDSLETMRRMKQQYDPDGVLSPGRSAGGL